MYTFWTGKIILSFFLYFLGFFEKKISFSEKITQIYSQFHRPPGAGGLWNWESNFFPEI